ncbi:MAG: hypothetical protein IJ507_00750 [Clostridia bacterium]|nr:hypothetical protein [Clostridia bacterium]
MLKRLIAALLAVMLLCLSGAALGDEPQLRGYDKKAGYVYLTMGEYPQTKEGEIKPILWRVLSVENDRAYIVSEYILLAHRIHPDDNEWIANNADLKTTEIWDYMNNDFLPNCFTEEEQGLVVDTEELGKMFLLSREDLKNKELGFGTNKSRKAWGTEYALANGLFKYSHRHGKHSPYWTRSQSTTAKYGGVCTKAEGNLGYIRVVVADEGCRPACYLDLTRLTITGGEGTMENPYTVGGIAE